MKLEDGDIIEIGGKQGMVCFNTEYNGLRYICVSFENENANIYYEIYDYKYENDKLLVAKINDPKELNEVVKIFFDTGLDEVGVPDELASIIEEKLSDN